MRLIRLAACVTAGQFTTRPATAAVGAIIVAFVLSGVVGGVPAARAQQGGSSLPEQVAALQQQVAVLQQTVTAQGQTLSAQGQQLAEQTQAIAALQTQVGSFDPSMFVTQSQFAEAVAVLQQLIADSAEVAGPGLIRTGNMLSIDLAYLAATFRAKSDVIPWAELVGLPPGFADGTDD